MASDRKLIVAVVGDDSSFQRALARSTAAAKQFGAQVNKAMTPRGDLFAKFGMQGAVEDLRATAQEVDRLNDQTVKATSSLRDMAVAGAKVGAGLFIAGRVLSGAGRALAVVQGHASSTSQSLGDVGDAFTSLVTLDLAGFFDAVGGSAKRAEEAFQNYAKSLDNANESSRALRVSEAAAALGHENAAKAIREQVSELERAVAATDALNFSQREFNVTVLDGITTLVAFKGARDAAFGGGIPELQAPVFGPPSKTLPPLSPSQRRELELLTAQDAEKIPLLKDRLAQLNGQLADFNGNQEQRLKLATRAKQTEAELNGIYAARKALAAAEEAAAKQRAADAKRRARRAAEAARRAAQEQREALLAAEQARQFRALGLTATGNRPPPTIANLLKQITQLSGRSDLSGNQRGVIARIRKVLIDPLRKATPETREAAKGLIDAIREGFDEGLKEGGPLTKTTSLRANKILAGLGLDETETKRLRARLSSFNSAGIANAGTSLPSGQFRGGITVENHNTIQVDRDVVARNVTISQQKTRRRNPVQKRGSRRGGV